MNTDGYPQIERFLSDKIGLDPESLGKKSIANAVDAAMKVQGTNRVDDYFWALRSVRENQEDLIERVIVPETWFFRDGESYNFLRIYLGEAGFPGSERKPLRLLSAPCSTGEEPYSIAMALLEMGYPPERFRIDAVDISARSIDIAKKAVYGRGSFRQKGKEPYECYFSKTEDGLRIDPEVSGLIHFYQDNLAKPSALWKHEPYDIVFCRNLLIYLTQKGRRTVIANIDRLLVSNGLLFAGNSEVVTFLQHGYCTVKHEMSFACRKTGADIGQRFPAPRPRTSPAKKEPRIRSAAEAAPAEEEAKIVSEKVQPGRDEISLDEIRSLADRGKLHEALRQCEQFLKGSRHHLEGYYVMGLISFALDSYGVAEQSFQRVLYLDPSHHEALVHMGLLYERKGDHEKAEVIRRRIERRMKKTSGLERV
jgi:chemotaxis protein methyltransferase WspC